jgi:hypothetical protein
MELSKKLPNDGVGDKRLAKGHTIEISNGIRGNQRNNDNPY